MDKMDKYGHIVSMDIRICIIYIYMCVCDIYNAYTYYTKQKMQKYNPERVQEPGLVMLVVNPTRVGARSKNLGGEQQS